MEATTKKLAEFAKEQREMEEDATKLMDILDEVNKIAELKKREINESIRILEKQKEVIYVIMISALKNF